MTLETLIKIIDFSLKKYFVKSIDINDTTKPIMKKLMKELIKSIKDTKHNYFYFFFDTKFLFDIFPDDLDTILEELCEYWLNLSWYDISPSLLNFRLFLEKLEEESNSKTPLMPNIAPLQRLLKT